MSTSPVDSRLTDEQLAELLALAETWFDHDGPTVNDLRILKAVRELQELRASATARDADIAAEVSARETLKQHIHQLRRYADHKQNCMVNENGLMGDHCTCGLDALLKQGIAR